MYMATEDNDNDIIVRERSTPPFTSSETLIDIDNMYSLIGRTIQALAVTTVNGETDLDGDIQAHSTKGLLPDTELEMLRSGVVPSSRSPGHEPCIA